MLYACAFRAYYFIKGRQGGRITRRAYYRLPRIPTIKTFNTLQLRTFKKRIKRTAILAGAVATLLITEKTQI